MAFIDTHTFDGFDASDGESYFVRSVAFTPPSKTDGYRRWLASGGEPRTFMGTKYVADPGPVHALSVDVTGTTVALMEAAVAALKAAVVPGVTWAFTPKGSATTSSATVRSVEVDGEYVANVDGRTLTTVTFAIETTPGWRTAALGPYGATVALPAAISFEAYGDMDAATSLRILPAQATTMIATGLKSGPNYAAVLTQDYSGAAIATALGGERAASSTLDGTLAVIGTPDSLNANTVRGRYAAFARLIHTDTTAADTTYAARSTVAVAEPSDTITDDTATIPATHTAAQGWEVANLGNVRVPVADVPGLTDTGSVAEATLYTTTVDSGDISSINRDYAQTFTLDDATLITEVKVKACQTSVWNPVKVYIFDTSAGVPVSTNPRLIGQVVTVAAESGVHTYKPNLWLDAGTYAVVIKNYSTAQTLYCARDTAAGSATGTGYTRYPSGTGSWAAGDGVDSTVDFYCIVKGKEALALGASVSVLAANSGGGNAYVDYVTLLPIDEAYAVARNSFAAADGIAVDTEANDVYLASATGVGASLLWRSSSINVERSGSFMLRPGWNTVHIVADTPYDAAPGDVEYGLTYWPTYELPVGV